MNCRSVKTWLEQGLNSPAVDQHLEGCAGCRQYQTMRQWSRQVLLQGQLEASAPGIGAIWASIHRAAEQSWDTALTRSFHRLLPYLVTIAVLLLAVAGFLPGNASVPTSRGAAILLNANETVATTQVSDLTAQAPGDMLGLPRH